MTKMFTFAPVSNSVLLVVFAVIVVVISCISYLLQENESNGNKVMYSILTGIAISTVIVCILKFYPRKHEKDLVFMSESFWDT